MSLVVSGGKSSRLSEGELGVRRKAVRAEWKACVWSQGGNDKDFGMCPE